MTTLSRLQKVPLRSVWKGEASDFTPWLAQEENLTLLGETLGLDLAFEDSEHSVGAYKADIVCKDASTDGFVIIENQLEKTDHTHLGQILTYAAGLNAKVVIWVAATFTSEHRAALDFLNEHTSEDLGFFGVEIELYRIGDSPVAPSFNVVCKPNDWAKTVRSEVKAASEASPLKRKQMEFWSKLNEKALETKAGFRPQKPSPQHWNSFSLGRSGIHGSCTINSTEKQLGLSVNIDHTNSKAIFQRLLARKDEIEQRLGYTLDWRELPDNRVSRILVFKDSFDFNKESEWGAGVDWLIKHASKFSTVFRPIIKEISFD